MTMDIETMMTNDMQTTDTTNSIPMKPTGIGARLKAAREAMHLSEKDAAARLHLNPKLIVIMETEDFENGLPATFIRGYIRSYGRLLNLPIDELDIAIEQLGIHIPPSTTPSIPKLHTPLSNNNERYVQWLTYIIVLVLLALVGIWWSTHPRDDKPKALSATVTPVPASAPLPTTTPAPLVTTPTASSTPLNTPITAQPPVNSSSKSAPQIANPHNAQTTPPGASTSQNTDTVTKSSAAEETQTSNLQSQPAEQKETMQMDLPEPGLDTSDY